MAIKYVYPVTLHQPIPPEGLTVVIRAIESIDLVFNVTVKYSRHKLPKQILHIQTSAIFFPEIDRLQEQIQHILDTYYLHAPAIASSQSMEYNL